MRVPSCPDCHRHLHLERFRPLAVTPGRKLKACSICGEKRSASLAVWIRSDDLKSVMAYHATLNAESVDSWDDCVEERPPEPIISRIDTAFVYEPSRKDVRRWSRWRHEKTGRP